MRIVIDMQGAQTENRFKAIGRCNMSLTRAILRNRGDHEIILALNGMLADTIEPIRTAFDGLLPQDSIRVWHAPGPIRACDPENAWRRRVAGLIREAFLASLRPDIIHIPSLFEGYVDDAVISVGSFDPSARICISLLDLDLLLNRNDSLEIDSNIEQFLQHQTACLERATQLLTISDSLRKETLEGLDIDESRIINIAPGIDSCPQLNELAWDDVSQKMINSWEHLLQQKHDMSSLGYSRKQRLKLAFISPLPPERTGIADYSAVLIPALTEHYDIVIIVDQKQVELPTEYQQHAMVRDIQWLRAHAGDIDRVVYQIGNSPYHQHMLPLLREIPGTVVLHDFYISGLLAWLEVHANVGEIWTRALYASHGYPAVRDRFMAKHLEETVMAYPVNLKVLQCARGVIVHSEYSRKLIQRWYGEGADKDCDVIPLVRSPCAKEFDRETARTRLGLATEDFIICSFGFIGHTKLNHRLLDAWLESTLKQNSRCKLIFVGENPGNPYGMAILEKIRFHGLEKRIKITGFVAPQEFESYLTAADVAVQLRTHSRGETSAAMLDCLNYGLPTIVNAHGSMAELPKDAVWLLPDEFTDVQLSSAIETLSRDSDHRIRLSHRAREITTSLHTPTACAQRYVEAIEHFHSRCTTDIPALLRTIAGLNGYSPNELECHRIAQAISVSIPLMRPARRLLLDISATCRNDLRTGIERVARALLITLINAPPDGYRIEPVYLCKIADRWHYRYARHYTLNMLNCSVDEFEDDIVEPECGDILLSLDLSGDMLIGADQTGLYTHYRNQGVALYAVVFDLLPVLLPEAFPPEADKNHEQWLHSVAKFDGVVCISKAVADEFTSWQRNNVPKNDSRRMLKISWFHLGADVEQSVPTKGIPEDADLFFKTLSKWPSFLMVGTIEPRKGHLQVIEAFTQLWDKGFNVNLVIVGQEGWKTWVPENMRRTIPEIMHRLKTHLEKDTRLFWLGGISDEYLEQIYAASTCLIAASEGEGFGLPLIEAAQHKLPIIARDIPVFREVAGEHAYYFSGNEPEGLANSIQHWIELHTHDAHPKSVNISWLSWKDSADRIKHIVCGNQGEIVATRLN